LDEPVPSERELEILKVLWELEEASVRQVHETMYPHGESAFNTVQTQLRIMQKKGLVTHRAEGRTFYYTAAHDRERVSSRFLHKVFDGALDQLVLSMLQAEDSGPDELKELERLIAKARRQKEAGKKRGK
jgi:BlaI family transcriptional regulator, penicillinase repressor